MTRRVKDGTKLRSSAGSAAGSGPAFDFHFVDIALAPAFGRLVAFDDRMAEHYS